LNTLFQDNSSDSGDLADELDQFFLFKVGKDLCREEDEHAPCDSPNASPRSRRLIIHFPSKVFPLLKKRSMVFPCTQFFPNTIIIEFVLVKLLLKLLNTCLKKKNKQNVWVAFFERVEETAVKNKKKKKRNCIKIWLLLLYKELIS